MSVGEGCLLRIEDCKMNPLDKTRVYKPHLGVVTT
jgi:hypothetical protein